MGETSANVALKRAEKHDTAVIEPKAERWSGSRCVCVSATVGVGWTQCLCEHSAWFAMFSALFCIV